MIVDQNNAYSINVSNPEERKDSFSKYIVYEVSGNSINGTFKTVRRFKEFEKLRKALLLLWPGCYIPSLPFKKSVGNLGNEFVFKRMKQLNRFLNQILNKKHLFESEEFQLFLVDESSASFEKQIEPVIKANSNVFTIIDKYSKAFPEIQDMKSDSSHDLAVKEFIQYLSQSVEMLKNFKQMAKNSQETKKNYQREFEVNFIQYMMPEYETNCISEYMNLDKEQLPFVCQKEKLSKLINNENKSNCYDLLYNNLKGQIGDIMSMLECLKQKSSYDESRNIVRKKEKDIQMELQNLLANKKSITEFFKGGDKEEKSKQLEIRIQNIKEEVAIYENICNMINIRLVNYDIKEYKKEKEKEYCNLVREMALLENLQLKNIQEFWYNISE